MTDVDECPNGIGGNHKLEPIGAGVKGRGSGSTYVIKHCSRCGNLVLDFEAEVVGEVGR